jgi:hypothetical protein
VGAAAATVGNAEKTWTGHHRNDSSSDLRRSRRMGEVERSRCLCTGEVGDNYRMLWEEAAAGTLHGWVVGEECCDMLT